MLHNLSDIGYSTLKPINAIQSLPDSFLSVLIVLKGAYMLEFLHKIVSLPKYPVFDHIGEELRKLYYSNIIFDKHSGDDFVFKSEKIFGEQGRIRAEHMLLCQALIGTLSMKEWLFKIEYKKKSRLHYKILRKVLSC